MLPTLSLQSTIIQSARPSKHFVINSERINLQAKFEFYEVEKFSFIMKLAKVLPSDILKSVEIVINRESVFKAGQGAGKSGSFFFFSEDKKFIIKSMKKSERILLVSKLPRLIEHFNENPDSLIAKVFALFSIKTKHYASMDFVVMQNVASSINLFNSQIVFDLKGSSFNRQKQVKHKFWNS